jgi:hypothetical protein
MISDETKTNSLEKNAMKKKLNQSRIRITTHKVK